jgi:hypothetical protein
MEEGYCGPGPQRGRGGPARCYERRRPRRRALSECSDLIRTYGPIPEAAREDAVPAKPRRSARSSRCLTDEGCHRAACARAWLPVGRRFAGACDQGPPPMPRPRAVQQTRLDDTFRGQAPHRTAQPLDSPTRRLPVVQDPHDIPHGWSGRMRRTVGSQASSRARTPARWAASRLAPILRMASGSLARRPGLPPTRPRLRAASRPALVRSAISCEVGTGQQSGKLGGV